MEGSEATGGRHSRAGGGWAVWFPGWMRSGRQNWELADLDPFPGSPGQSQTAWNCTAVLSSRYLNSPIGTAAASPGVREKLPLLQAGTGASLIMRWMFHRQTGLPVPVQARTVPPDVLLMVSFNVVFCF